MGADGCLGMGYGGGSGGTGVAHGEGGEDLVNGFAVAYLGGLLEALDGGGKPVDVELEGAADEDLRVLLERLTNCENDELRMTNDES